VSSDCENALSWSFDVLFTCDLGIRSAGKSHCYFTARIGYALDLFLTYTLCLSLRLASMRPALYAASSAAPSKWNSLERKIDSDGLLDHTLYKPEYLSDFPTGLGPAYIRHPARPVRIFSSLYGAFFPSSIICLFVEADSYVNKLPGSNVKILLLNQVAIGTPEVKVKSDKNITGPSQGYHSVSRGSALKFRCPSDVFSGTRESDTRWITELRRDGCIL
jgi:hypothetical protein